MDTAAVNNGKVADNDAISSTKTSIKGSSNLGKDAFLQLLVSRTNAGFREFFRITHFFCSDG